VIKPVDLFALIKYNKYTDWMKWTEKDSRRGFDPSRSTIKHITTSERPVARRRKAEERAVCFIMGLT
jgi:hypothetical protein